MADRVRITEVAPRDGLQNEPGVIPAADKARLIAALAQTGVDEIEATSFVSPAWVPQLGDASEVLRLACADLASGSAPWRGPGGPMFSALVPNRRGMESFLEARASTGGSASPLKRAAVFTAASETFSRRNTNASISETLDRFAPVLEMARSAGVGVRGYISCAVACPFEGPIDPAAAARVADRLAALGVDEIDLADTIGVATPDTLSAAVREVMRALGLGAGSPGGEGSLPALTVHLHDTFGRAGQCVREALSMGVRSFDASAGGLGGCPYASTPHSRAPGNIATRTLVEVVRDAGLSCSVDAARLEQAETLALELVSAARAQAAGAGESEGPGETGGSGNPGGGGR